MIRSLSTTVVEDTIITRKKLLREKGPIQR